MPGSVVVNGVVGHRCIQQGYAASGVGGFVEIALLGFRPTLKAKVVCNMTRFGPQMTAGNRSVWLQN